jgi:hypothetical protein
MGVQGRPTCNGASTVYWAAAEKFCWASAFLSSYSMFLTLKCTSFASWRPSSKD